MQGEIYNLTLLYNINSYVRYLYSGCLVFAHKLCMYILRDVIYIHIFHENDAERTFLNAKL